MSFKPELLLLGAMLLSAACAQMPSSADPAAPIVDLMAMRRDAATLYKNGDFTAAAQRYQELTKRVPLESELWFLLGNSHARLGNNNQAVRAYREAVIRKPEYAKAWYNMGILRLMEGTRILIDAQQYLASDPQLKTAVQQLGEGVLELIEEENNRLARSNAGAPDEPLINLDEVEIIIMDRQSESPASGQNAETEE